MTDFERQLADEVMRREQALILYGETSHKTSHGGSISACTCDPEAYDLGPEGQRRYFEDRYCPRHGEAPQLRRLVVRIHEILQHGERDATYNSGVIGGALEEIEKSGFA